MKSSVIAKKKRAMRTCFKVIVSVACVFLIQKQAAFGQAAPEFPFKRAEKGSFRFNTGILQGTLRRNGGSTGVSSFKHMPTGTRLDGGAGILSCYRIFTKNKRYGNAAWGWPSKALLQSDGSVAVNWPATDDRPFELSVRYCITEAAVIDVEIRVSAEKDLPGFEVFLASYFSPAFPASELFVGNRSSAGRNNPPLVQDEGSKPGFMQAEKPSGIWQMYPACKKALDLIHDGRWKKEPHPVDWAIMPELALPLGVRRGEQRSAPAVFLMAPRADCFALSTPYRGESHYSLYLSLFGETVKAGEKASARSRLVVCPDFKEKEAVSCYRRYMKAVKPGSGKK